MFNESPEEELLRQEKYCKELEIRNEGLNNLLENACIKKGTTSEELYLYSIDEDNFYPHEWNMLQEMRQQKHMELKRDVANIRDKRKTQNTLASHGQVQQNWLFVR